jgi:hypothetical protein
MTANLSVFAKEWLKWQGLGNGVDYLGGQQIHQ